jgi:hypothetical protein
MVFGESGDDRLYGDAGDDNLYGGQGDDQLYGGRGKDRLRGEKGRDSFFDSIATKFIRSDYGFFTESWTNSQYDLGSDVPLNNHIVPSSTSRPGSTPSTNSTTLLPETPPAPTVVTSTDNASSTTNSSETTSTAGKDSEDQLVEAIKKLAVILAYQQAQQQNAQLPPLYSAPIVPTTTIWNPNTLGGDSLHFGLNHHALSPPSNSSAWMNDVFAGPNSSGGVSFFSSGYKY